MEHPESLTPWKKRKLATDYSLCVLCQLPTPKPLVKSPNLEALRKVISMSKERADCGDQSVIDFVKRVTGISAEEIKESGGVYHRHCYADYSNVTKRDRALARFSQAFHEGTSSTVTRQPGRPSSSKQIDDSVSDDRTLRSQSVPYDQNLCIICQTAGGVLRTVAFLETGHSMLHVAEKMEDKGFFLRLNTIPSAADAVANEVKYHLKCWSSCKQSVNKVHPGDDYESECTAAIVSDIELINIIATELNESTHKVLDMNSINITYRNLLFENGVAEADIKSNYKRYLKDLITNTVPNAKFVKNSNPSKSEQVCSETAQGQVIDIAVAQSKADNLTEILNVSKIVGNELLSQKKWAYQGSFSNFQEAPLLSALIKWILIGPNQMIEHESRRESIEKKFL